MRERERDLVCIYDDICQQGVVSATMVRVGAFASTGRMIHVSLERDDRRAEAELSSQCNRASSTNERRVVVVLVAPAAAAALFIKAW
jgi:aspartate-semialdehyde dehydrogenase